MTIRTTGLGGTNWGSEKLTSADLNDTMTALYSKVKTLTSFWMISDLKTLYDDFSGYSVGALTTNSKWTVSAVTGGGSTTPPSVTCSIVSHNDFNTGTSNELYMYAHSDNNQTGVGTVSVTTLGFTVNKHKHIECMVPICQGYNSGANTATLKLTFGSLSPLTIYSSIDATGGIQINTYLNINIIAKGSNVYDIWVGSYLLASNQTTATCQLKLEVQDTDTTTGGPCSSGLYINNVCESANSV